MPKIFISYRRADSRKDAGRIYDRLVDAFGKDNIFKDVDNIPFGDDFRGILSEAVNQCDVVLAIIGKEWLHIKDADGKRRLDNVGDFVRIEIQTGLQRGGRCLVVPVLVDGAGMPSSDDLPPDLRELAFKNASTVRDDPDFHNDVARLIRGLQERYGASASAESPVPPPVHNVQTLIAHFYTVFDERNWEESRQLLAEIRASGKAPRVFNIDAHEKEIWAAVEAEERDHEYDVLRMMAARPKPFGIWDALQKFWENFPNYDPDNFARFQPAPPPTPLPSIAVLGIRGDLSAVKLPDMSRLTSAVLKVLPSPFEWCFVPGGNVTLETNPPKTYTIPDFAIAKYTITNAQFDKFVDGTERDGYMYETDYGWYNFSNDAQVYRSNNPKPKSTGFTGIDLPRTNVTWYDAVAFTRWLSRRLGHSISLPTEQQWQRAAIGDIGWTYPWGDQFDKSRCNTTESSNKKPVSVTEYPTGASPFGVFNMSGNVWEWCLNDYEQPADVDSQSKAEVRVLRGGSFSSGQAFAAASSRVNDLPYGWVDYSGFRVVLAAPMS